MRHVGWIAAGLMWLSVTTVDAAPAGWGRLAELLWSQPGRTKPERPPAVSNKTEGLGTDDPAAVKAFWDRADIALAGMKARGISLPMAESPNGKFVALVDKAAVGLFYDENGPSRYLALHLTIGNTFAARPPALHHSVLMTEFDGQPQPRKNLPRELINHGFQTGGESVSLQNCQPFPLWQMPAKGIAGQWLIFPHLPAGAGLPKVTIKLPALFPEEPRQKVDLEINVAECQRALLQLDVERLGPRDSLALITIGGMMNSYNLYGLADELDTLVNQKVSRAVIEWTPTAPAPDGQLLNWLQQSAMSSGTGRATNEQLPPIHSSLQDLHLVQLKGGGFSTGLYRGQPGAPKVHASAAEAVSAALMSGLLTLSRDGLREQIEKGHPLARSAALRHGATQLDVADVPYLRQLSQDENDTVRGAALEALGDFATIPEVRERLEEVARTGTESDAATAINGLASSRYAAGRKAIEQWLADPDATLRKRVLAVLADQPRPEWGDALFAHAHGPDGRVRVDVLRALVPLDHPRLVVLLEEALTSSDKSLRDFVFLILSQRTDERSERLATRHVLTAIEQAPPDSAMIEFLSRTKDQRALPAILRHLDASTDRSALINLLGQMGDRRSSDHLVQKYSQFKPHEQSAVLHALRALRHEKFPELAGTALVANDGTLLTSATQGLLQDGSRAAVEALARGLEKQTQPYAIAMICNALSGIGTSEARQALLVQRGSKEPARRKAAMEALQNLQMRSPAYNYIHQARTHRINHQDEEALETYQLAIEIDPELADAYAGRGEILLKREKWSDAAADLTRAAELDPYNGHACCGSAIAMVMLGRYEDGVRTVESARERLTGDLNYAYNAACVYGRLVEATLKQGESTERETRLKEYRRLALSDLDASIKLGFRDFAWMREDPDLKSLHDQKEFHDLIAAGEKAKPE